jgi:hypothetical protein
MKKRAIFVFVLVNFYTFLFLSFAGAKCGNYTETLPSKAFASSVESDNYLPEKAIDRTAVTHWKSNASEAFPQWIYFDLGEKKCVKGAELYVYRTFGPIKMDIQISDDEQIWRNVVSQWKVNGGNYTKKEFSEVPARYVRIYQTEGARGFGSLSEIRIMSAPIEGITLFNLPGSIRGTIPDKPLVSAGNVVLSSGSARGFIENSGGNAINKKTKIRDIPKISGVEGKAMQVF